jgi:hypothetical protein
VREIAEKSSCDGSISRNLRQTLWSAVACGRQRAF